MTDLYDVSNCSRAPVCGTCGGAGDLRVVTVMSAVGLLCLTLCGDCADAERLPTLPAWSVTIELVWRHCAHRGVNPDEAAELLRAEEDG